MAEHDDAPLPSNESAAPRVFLVIVLELAILFGGTYGTWRWAGGQGKSIRPRQGDESEVSGYYYKQSEPAGMVDPEGPPMPRLLALTLPDHPGFGIDVHDSDYPRRPGEEKRLISDSKGVTNELRVRIDGEASHFATGVTTYTKTANNPPRLASSYFARVQIEQDLRVALNPETGRKDTVVVQHTVTNHDLEPHKVGLRFLLDTHVGSIDGVPFAVPGQPGLISEPWVSDEPRDVPDFIQAIEAQDLREPGTIAHLALRLPRFLPADEPEPEAVQRIVIADRDSIGADWEIKPVREAVLNKDRWNSCIVMYWPERVMKPHEKRIFVFTYGLGRIVHEYGAADPHLALTYGPRPVPGGEFTIMAWLKNANRRRNVELTLPEEFKLVEGARRQKGPIGGDALTQVSWRIRVDPGTLPDTYSVDATNGDESVRLVVQVRAPDHYFGD
jgi:hypothetical protein